MSKLEFSDTEQNNGGDEMSTLSDSLDKLFDGYDDIGHLSSESDDNNSFTAQKTRRAAE
jgi:hypothetical protein